MTTEKTDLEWQIDIKKKLIEIDKAISDIDKNKIDVDKMHSEIENNRINAQLNQKKIGWFNYIMMTTFIGLIIAFTKIFL